MRGSGILLDAGAVFEVGIPTVGLGFLAFHRLGDLQVAGGETKHQLSVTGISDGGLRRRR